MAKHAFKFPREVVEAVKQHVRNALCTVTADRYGQEANYTAALVARLEGTAYEGKYGRIVFTSTVIDDRGYDSAEHRYGADFAITATISDGRRTITKVILVQAKLGHIRELGSRGRDTLLEQIRKMMKLLPAPKVMEIPDYEGTRWPAMVSARQVLSGEPYKPMNLPEYFAARVTTTLDGCTDVSVVNAVQDSSLSRVNVDAKIAPNKAMESDA